MMMTMVEVVMVLMVWMMTMVVMLMMFFQFQVSHSHQGDEYEFDEGVIWGKGVENGDNSGDWGIEDWKNGKWNENGVGND